MEKKKRSELYLAAAEAEMQRFQELLIDINPFIYELVGFSNYRRRKGLRELSLFEGTDTSKLSGRQLLECRIIALLFCHEMTK
jgi:hypothetical protein